VTATERPPRDQHVELDGVALVGFGELVDRIAVAYPELDRGDIESTALREYEAFTGGIPLAVPAALEEGLHELFGAEAADEDAA
jgi:hypothetical protein